MSLFPPFDETVKHAALSTCERYRYTLTRHWDPRRPRLGWVMLNPSTADASIDDPTIRRCMGFARRESFGGITVANLFAWRATKPADLLEPRDPFGPANVDALEGLFASHATVVAAWGASFANIARSRNSQWGVLNHVGGVPDHPKMVRAMAARHGASLVCLGVTGDGSPRHPLYVKGDAPFIPWTVPS